MIVEYEFDEYIMLRGNYIETDDSFNHSFGLELQKHKEIKDFEILLYIADKEINLTPLLENTDEELVNKWRDKLLNYARSLD